MTALELLSVLLSWLGANKRFWILALVNIVAWNIGSFRLKALCQVDDDDQQDLFQGGRGEADEVSSSLSFFRGWKNSPSRGTQLLPTVAENWPRGYLATYIYELPHHLSYVREENITYACGNMFSAEWVIPNLMQSSPTWRQVWNVTTNPDDATVFFIPARFSCGLQSVAYDGDRSPWGTNHTAFREVYIPEVIKYIRTTYPYFDRSNGGEDHILPLTMSGARCELPEVSRGVIKNTMVFSLVGYRNENSDGTIQGCVDRSRDVIVPPVTYLQQDPDVIRFKHEVSMYEDMGPYRLMHLNVPFQIPTSKPRKTLLYFRGSISHDVRSVLLQTYQGKEDTDIKKGWADSTELYARGFYNSEFAMCPRGGQPSSPRFIDAMNGGAIPAVISDDWLPAFADDFPPELYSIRISEQVAQEGKLLDVLRAVSQEEKDGLRENLPRALRAFSYQYDAMLWIQRQVMKRLPLISSRARREQKSNKFRWK